MTSLHRRDMQLPQSPSSFACAVLALTLAVAALPTLAATGRTAGAGGVSELTGAAQYAIPLFAQPGAAGLTPKIALEYSSSSGNGILGVGWRIAGLSAITRCAKTVAQDGAARSVQLDLADRFCLDGNQLKLYSGTYGQAGSIYQTELETYSRITATGTAGNGPSAFLVETKEGLKLSFGSTADSRIEALGSTTVRAWALSVIADRAGNQIFIEYEEDAANGAYRPARITWNRHTSNPSSYPYKMEFVYEAAARPDPIVGYFAGSRIKEAKRLDRIDLTHNGATLIRRYEIAYEQSPTTLRSRVSSIQECGAGGAHCYPATTVTYANGATGWGAKTSYPGIPGTPWTPQRIADINGDGLQDLLLTDSSSNLYYALGTQGGTFQGPYAAGIQVDFGPEPFAGTGTRLIDYDADGDMDVLISVVLTPGVWRFSTAGSPFTQIASGSQPFGVPLDYDGDGRTDLINVIPASPTIEWYRNTGAGFAAAQVVYTASSPEVLLGVEMTWPRHPQRMDFNGDGRVDLLVNLENPTNGTSRYAVLLAGSGGYTEAASIAAALVAADDFFFINVNGDRCADLLRRVFTGVTTSMTLHRSTCGRAGQPLFDETTAIPQLPFLERPIYPELDWDGDGRHDLVFTVWDQYQGATAWYVHRANGESYDSSATYIGNGSAVPIGLASDLNGDGLTDVFQVTQNPYGQGDLGQALHSGATIPDLAASVTDGLGNSIAFTYTTTARGNHTIWSPGGYPYQSAPGANYVVASMSESDGVGGSLASSFWYYGAARDASGRGELGFGGFYRWDPRAQIQRYTYRYQAFPHTGLSNRLDRYTGGGALIEFSQLGWSSHAFGAGYETRKYPWQSGLWKYDYEVGGALAGQSLRYTNISITVDSSTGTVTDRFVTVQEPSGAGGAQPGASYTQRTLVTSLFTDWVNWCIGRPMITQQINAHTAFGGTQQTRTKNATWSGQYCRATQELSEPGSPTLEIKRDLAYDGFGNVSTETLTGRNPDGSAMSGRATQTNWGTLGILSESITNALSHAVDPAYDYSKGVKTSETDPNGNATAWQFDGFNRLTRLTRPDATYTTWSYTGCAPSCVNSLNKMLVIETDYNTAGVAQRDIRRYLDAFEREIARSEKLLFGGYNRIDRTFDARGNLASVSAPCPWQTSPCFYPAEASYRTNYGYDTLNRLTTVSQPISESLPTPRTTTTYHEGLARRTVDAEGKQSTLRVNVLGAAVRTTDHDLYAVSIDRDAFGNAVRVTDSASSTLRTASFDLLGNEIASTDLDAGSWTYQVNSLGEQLRVRDAKTASPGWTQVRTYDALSRMSTRQDVAEGITSTWVWGTSSAARNIGRLEHVRRGGSNCGSSTTAAYCEAYTFDSVGRRSQTTIRVSGQGSHTINYTYNSLGALDTLTYPTSTSSYRLKLQYDYQNGQLLRVKDFNAPSTVFWEASATNARGQVTSEAIGKSAGFPGGLLTARAYDATDGSLRSIQTGPSGTPTSLQNLSYFWDEVGNLIQRQDNRQGLTENAYYDNLHRLDRTTLNGAENLNVNYDAMGNVVYKSDLNASSWSYDPIKRHQLTQAGSYTYSYDANGNMSTREAPANTISWYSYNLPNVITRSGSTNTYQYGPERGRFRLDYVSGGVTETTIYLGGLIEKWTKGSLTEWRHYVSAEGRPVALYTRQAGSASANLYRYLHLDHQGSIETITDATGGVYVRESFTAFGQRRGATGWSLPLPSGDATLIGNASRRGYTFHESLGGAGLNHMNGRVQDPLTGRFLSVDPIIDGALSTQGWNPYAYVKNNPLTFTDPTGYEQGYEGELFITAQRWTLDYGLLGLQSYLSQQAWGLYRDLGGLPNEINLALQSLQQSPVSTVGGALWAIPSDLLETAEELAGTEDLLADAGLEGGLVGSGGLIDIRFEDPQAAQHGATLTRHLAAFTPAGRLTRMIRSVSAVKKAAKSAAQALRPRGVPAGWVQQAGRKAGNTKYVNPANPHDYVRVKPDGTITQVRNGKAFDINGNPVNLNSPDAHGITPDQFIFRE